VEVVLYRGIAINTIGYPPEEQERGLFLGFKPFFSSAV